MITCGKCKTSNLEAFNTSVQGRATGWCRDCYRKWYEDKSGGIIQFACEYCNEVVSCTYRASKRRRFCSRECKDLLRRKKIKDNLIKEKEVLDRYCLHCGKGLSPSHRSDAVYCSERCNSAAHQWTRKARMKVIDDGEVLRVDRAYILERDGGRCHICRKRVRRGDIQIDHIIPLSRGGGHALDNLAVACSRCNLSKGNRSRGEQLLIFG